MGSAEGNGQVGRVTGEGMDRKDGARGNAHLLAHVQPTRGAQKQKRTVIALLCNRDPNTYATLRHCVPD